MSHLAHDPTIASLLNGIAREPSSAFQNLKATPGKASSDCRSSCAPWKSIILRTFIQRPLALLLMALGPGEIFAAQSSSQRKDNLPEMISTAEKGVLFIRVLNAQGQPVSMGTGFLTDNKGSVLTALHVLRSPMSNRRATAIEALDSTGRSISVKGVKSEDESLDLVLLQLSETPENGAPLTLSREPPPVRGDFVLVLGHPLEFRFVATDGIVSAVNKTSELPRRFYESTCPQAAPDALWIQTTASVSMGNSGGPMLDASGKVIGVMEWQVFGSGMSFAIHVSAVHKFLAKTQSLISFEDFIRPEAELSELISNLQREYSTYASQTSMRKNAIDTSKLPTLEHPGLKYFPKLRALADAHPGRNVELKALLFVALELSDLEAPDALDSEVKLAGERLVDKYRDDRRILPALRRKMHPVVQGTRDCLGALAKKTSDPEIRAIAAYSLAGALAPDSCGKTSLKESIAFARMAADAKPEIMIGQDSVAKLGGDLLDGLSHCMPGCAAPELAGKDPDGKDVKLSDLSGRYVLVAFWNARSDFFRATQDTLDGLARTFEGAPLSIIGVKARDSTMPESSVQKVSTVKWPCISEDMTGPLLKAWYVKSSPTFFIVDPKGVIAYRIAPKPTSSNMMTDNMFSGFSSSNSDEWKDRLKKTLEGIPELVEPQKKLTAFLMQGPWVTSAGFLGKGTHTIFLRDHNRSSVLSVTKWNANPPYGLHIDIKGHGCVDLDVDLATGQAIVRKPDSLTSHTLKLRDFPPVQTEDSAQITKIRELLLKETWEWFDSGKKEGKAAFMKFHFKKDGTTDSGLLPAWEIMPSGQIRVYVYLGTYWTFDLNIEEKTARNDLALSQIKDQKMFSAVKNTAP